MSEPVADGRPLGSTPVSTRSAITANEGRHSSPIDPTGSSSTSFSPTVYRAHSPLAASRIPEPASTVPSSGKTYRHTRATTPAAISPSPAACVPRGAPRPPAITSAATNSGTIPGTIEPTNAAEVREPPYIAARKNGTPAPQAILSAVAGRTAASARRRRHSAGARTTSGTPKRSSAASAGRREEALRARALSAKAAQISTVTARASRPCACGESPLPPAGRARTGAGAGTVFVATKVVPPA